MKKRIMITSLKNRKDIGEINYYYFNDGAKNMYIDALTSTEASCKYILSNYDIDLILTFGSESTYDPGDDEKLMPLEEGKLFFAEENSKMSNYSLLRYRLAEFLDDINAEIMDESEILDAEEKKAAKKFVRDFINDTEKITGKKRLNKFFNVLSSNDDLRKLFDERLVKDADENKIDKIKYRKWILYYLYNEYIDYGKMHLLDGNEDVQIRFLSSGVGEDNGLAFADLLIQNLNMILKLAAQEGVDDVELYLCLQDDNSKDTFVLTSLIEMIKSTPENSVNVEKIIMTDSYSKNTALKIYDDTEKYYISDLISATKAFLKYGKTDMLMEYRETLGEHSSAIDGVLYAMKNIDTGISLCDIMDIERGIGSLRQYFMDDIQIEGNSFSDKYFNVIMKAVEKDFGPLITSDKIEFIDLVKWAYKKGFWQQTLTLIESRAPREFIDKGIYYYAKDEESRQDAVEKFGTIYYNLKPFEKYKLHDIAHYYIKFYSRARVGHKDDSKAYQLDYATTRISELTDESGEYVKAYTLCPDINALKDLLFAYYYLGDIRNATNHAQDEFSGFVSIMEASDISERMNLIKHSVDFFIYCYDKVLALVEKENSDYKCINIETAELVDFTKRYRLSMKDNHKIDNDKNNAQNGPAKPQGGKPQGGKPRTARNNKKTNKDSDK